MAVLNNGHKWDLMVPRGWINIIRDLIRDLNKLEEDITILQVKEKFGGLRFYVGACSEEAHQRIDEAEDLSYDTCQVCGSTENVSTDDSGWVETLCDKCLKERDS